MVVFIITIVVNTAVILSNKNHCTICNKIYQSSLFHIYHISFTYIISVTTTQEQLHLNPPFHMLLLTCFLDRLSLCIAFLSVLYFLSTDDWLSKYFDDSSVFSRRTLMSSMMQALHLSNNGLKSLPSTLFKMCSQLCTLDLHGTEITMDVLRQVAALPFPTTTKRNYSILLEFKYNQWCICLHNLNSNCPFRHAVLDGA